MSLVASPKGSNHTQGNMRCGAAAALIPKAAGDSHLPLLADDKASDSARITAPREIHGSTACICNLFVHHREAVNE